MKNIDANYKNVEKLLSQGIGYSLFTVSSVYGIQKIAIKKKLFKDNYTLIYCSGEENDDKTVKSLETTVKLKKDGTLSIGGFPKFNVDDACFTLKNPSQRILLDTQAIRKAEEFASERTRFDVSTHYEQVVKERDDEIKDIKRDFSTQQMNSNYRRMKDAFDLTDSLIEIKEHKVLSIKKYEYGREARKYVCTDEETVDNSYRYGVDFIAELLKDKFKHHLSEESLNLCDEIISLNKRIDQIYHDSKSFDGDFDKRISAIQSLSGFIAADLRTIIFNLCDSMRDSDIDTSLYDYNESGVKDYWDNQLTKDTHEIYYRTIDNFFDSIIEGSATFIERVTGRDIRDEIKKRLNKEEVKQIIKK